MTVHPLRVRRWPARHVAAACIATVGVGTTASPSVSAVELRPCRLKGVEYEARCGRVQRPLDPQQPQGTSIDVHFALLPALARRKAADPVFFFAGGPGQSAIDLAGNWSKRFARFGNRRDMVFVDQRGTGRSAPLKCADDEERATARSLTEDADHAGRLQRLKDCSAALRKLPHGDLRQYTTPLAVADVDAVRDALGVAQVNVVGASYGSRVVLEYLRQHPQRVRRAVIDGAAPSDMVLPASFSPDNQAALEAVFTSCEAEPACRRRHPSLRAQWRQLLGRLPLQALVAHPFNGREEQVTIDRDLLLGAVRGALYAPMLAAALPAALDEAAQHRFGALLALGSALHSQVSTLATGMHFSVVCAEDMARVDRATDVPATDFAASFADLYRQVCADWPHGKVVDEFFRIAPTSVATLVLSGGADPATPPRHGDRVARALGAKALHVVVPQAGHGVLAIACIRDAVVRFVDAPDDAQALATDVSCAATLPRPPAFVPLGSSEEVAR